MKLRLTALLLTVLLLGGCAATAAPMFDPDTVQEAEAVSPERIARNEVFVNGNGSTEFRVALDAEFPAEPMPFLEAKPLHLTGEDAKAVIDAFFPDAQCWELHPKYHSPETSWTKAELQTNMERWRTYDLQDLAGFYGGEENLPGIMRENGDDVPYMEYWQESMAYFEDLLEKAPETNQRTPSLWRMFKETEYLVDPEEASRMDLSQDRDCLQAQVHSGSDYYRYVAASGLENGKPSTVISLSYTTRSSPGSVDWQIFLVENDALPAPTQEDLDKAQEIAQSYVDKFLIGQWTLEKASPSEHDGTIYVRGTLADSALPETVNGTSYNTPRMSIRIHPDGRLLDFWVGGGLTDVVTHAEQAAQLPMEELLEIGLNHLREGKTMAYGISEEMLISLQTEAGEDFFCTVDITQAERGFVGLDTPNGGVGYVPCLTLKGKVRYRGKETGASPESSGALPSGTVALVTVNAIDGSIAG